MTVPASIALDPSTIVLGALTEGTELKLFPGERLGARRIAATAGSTMYILLRFIETDLAYYVEEDQHKVLRSRQRTLVESGRLGSGPSRFGRGSEPGGGGWSPPER